MSKTIIMGALANTGIKNGDKILMDFLKKNIQDIEVIDLFTGPGIKNALDWQMIIDSVSFVANISTIAGTLWLAYEKFIAPLKKEDAFIFIQIKDEKGQFVQFSIGQEFKDKDVFITTFISRFDNLTVKVKFKNQTNKDRD